MSSINESVSTALGSGFGTRRGTYGEFRRRGGACVGRFEELAQANSLSQVHLESILNSCRFSGVSNVPVSEYLCAFVAATLVRKDRWLADYFVEKGFSKGLADWLGSNLKRASTTTEEMDWIFNVDGAYEMFASYRFVLDSPILLHISLWRGHS